MRRWHLVELEDLHWLPASIRDGVTDFLEYAVIISNLYKPIAPRLERALEYLQCVQIIDLCSGGGGPWKNLLKEIKPLNEQQIVVYLSDLYPNTAAFNGLRGKINFVTESVNATVVPVHLVGFRTLFSAFHHFRPEQAQNILQDAVIKHQGIAIFESTQRHVLLLLYMLFTPLLVLFATPFIHPFRWSRLFWTYLLPTIPLIVMFDGIVSCLRTYTISELTELTQSIVGGDNYVWEIGVEKLGILPVGVTYLIGYPKHSTDFTSVVG